MSSSYLISSNITMIADSLAAHCINTVIVLYRIIWRWCTGRWWVGVTETEWDHNHRCSRRKKKQTEPHTRCSTPRVWASRNGRTERAREGRMPTLLTPKSTAKLLLAGKGKRLTGRKTGQLYL